MRVARCKNGIDCSPVFITWLPTFLIPDLTLGKTLLLVFLAKESVFLKDLFIMLLEFLLFFEEKRCWEGSKTTFGFMYEFL